MRRFLFLVALIAAMSPAATATGNTKPVGGCPEPFELRATSDFTTAPPGLLESIDKNVDGFVCVMRHPQGQPGLNIIDNTASSA